MNIKKLCIIFAVAMAVSFTAVADDFLRGYEALPSNLGYDVRDIRPVFDFDGDGCLPAAGYSRAGVKNGGENISGTVTGGCRHSQFLNYSNTYHRYACFWDYSVGANKYCGHMFSLYMEKDQVMNNNLFIATCSLPILSTICTFANQINNGHPHDWEFVLVYTHNGVVTHGSYSHHGDITTDSASNIPQENGHLKFVYHKDASTHPMRFAQSNESAENSYGHFLTPQIMSWWTMFGDNVTNAQMRAKLNSDWTGAAKPANRDSAFIDKLNEKRPTSYPAFFQSDANSSISK